MATLFKIISNGVRVGGQKKKQPMHFPACFVIGGRYKATRTEEHRKQSIPIIIIAITTANAITITIFGAHICTPVQILKYAFGPSVNLWCLYSIFTPVQAQFPVAVASGSGLICTTLRGSERFARKGRGLSQQPAALAGC